MIIVTGGAGFIGSNLVRHLNEQGRTDILVVDNLKNAEKVKNLSDLRISDYMDKSEFYEFMVSGKKLSNVEAVFHQGACSDTMATDGQYVLHNNFTYSKELLAFCVQHNAQYVYASSASVYGAGLTFIEDPEFESTLNAYAWSKLLFDCYVRSLTSIPVQCVGLRYFNVYGPRESHKARMASVAWHFRNQLNENGLVKLFAGSGGFENGAQLRDFVYIDDVVDVNMHFLNHPETSGIYNVGTGQSQSFNDVALAVLNYYRQSTGDSLLTIEQAIDQGIITYIPMPDALQGKYQSYTQADLKRLNSSGYQSPFNTVEQGVHKYMSVLDQSI